MLNLSERPWTIRLHHLRLSVATMICCAISACSAIGPRVETNTVIVRPGNPLLILHNVQVTGRLLVGGETVTQDIGGWVAMPQEHFDALKRAVEHAGALP